MTKKPTGVNVNLMTREVKHLWELGEVMRLTPTELADYVGVQFRTVYYWFAGMKPQKAHEKMILDAIPKIEAAHPDPLKGVPPGEWVVGWGKSPLEKIAEDPAAKKAKEENEAEEDRFFRELENKIRAAQAREPSLASDALDSFLDVLYAAKKYNVKLPKIK